MTCPDCEKTCVWWSDPPFSSYGWGCTECRLFWTWIHGEWVSTPLNMAHFPERLRSTPKLREAVGWTDERR